jgi:hypothetical protein
MIGGGFGIRRVFGASRALLAMRRGQSHDPARFVLCGRRARPAAAPLLKETLAAAAICFLASRRRRSSVRCCTINKRRRWRWLAEDLAGSTASINFVQ